MTPTDIEAARQQEREAVLAWLDGEIASRRAEKELSQAPGLRAELTNCIHAISRYSHVRQAIANGDHLKASDAPSSRHPAQPITRQPKLLDELRGG